MDFKLGVIAKHTNKKKNSRIVNLLLFLKSVKKGREGLSERETSFIKVPYSIATRMCELLCLFFVF